MLVHASVSPLFDDVQLLYLGKMRKIFFLRIKFTPQHVSFLRLCLKVLPVIVPEQTLALCGSDGLSSDNSFSSH